MGTDRRGVTRRELLETAALTAGMATALLAAAPAVEAAPNGKKFPPLENFQYDLERSTGWVGPGGSAKEANFDEFPVSESIAGVSMRLQPGAMRELHWHAIAAEWGYVIEGGVRATVIAPTGQAEQVDFGPGDIWYFPKGHGHALQGLAPGETHFLLVFDNGHFSEFGTFSSTDWFAHTPRHVLARNLNLPESALASLPKGEAYIVPGPPPPPRPEPLRDAALESNQSPHKYRLKAAPAREFPGGSIRLVSSLEFPIQTTLTAALEELNPGALREMHWHPNADEWQFYLSGRARVTIFGAHGRMATAIFEPGQIGFVRQGFGHFVESIGSEPARLLALFNRGVYEEISVSEWMGANPPNLLAENFGLAPADVARLPKQARTIIA